MIASHSSARRAENSPATGSTLIFPQQDQTRSLTVVDATVEEDDSEVTLEENSADDRTSRPKTIVTKDNRLSMSMGGHPLTRTSRVYLRFTYLFG